MTVHSFTPEAAPDFPALHLIDEINHRVLNEYSETILALSNVAERATGSAQDAIYWAVSRLLSHAQAHRALQPPAAVGLVNLADHLGGVCEALSNAALTDNGVHVTLDADDVWLDASQCWRVGLIVAELVRNAARHGLAGEPGEIEVRLVERAGAINCFVCDSGGGATAGKPGRGLRLMRSIAAELGGSLDGRFTLMGSVVCLRLPSLAAAA
jgi:two-component sensor histidine kinase